MKSSRRARCAYFHPVLGLCCLAAWMMLPGCEPVQEDRTIEFSAQADTVGFQHGSEGVFVADKAGGGLKKIFQPDAGVLASSTPLWSPVGRQLVFTTARAADADQAGATAANTQVFGLLGGTEPDPAGAVFVETPIVYTCWLRDEATGEPPQKLFDARCDHAGYVAANLAVRWHPSGDQILYVDSIATGRHAVFAYDLKAKAARRVFPHDAPALIFDWSPDGKNLACVLGSPAPGSSGDGLWIGEPDAGPDAWWHVPASQQLARGELNSLIEQLRASRPAWTSDGATFAFVTQEPAGSGNNAGGSRLWVGALAGRRVEPVARDAGRLVDLHWSPRGEALGLVRAGREPGSGPASPAPARTLHVWTRALGLSTALETRPVRRFAGWCAAGDHLAYVVPDPIAGADRPLWSFLLAPDPIARDAVVIADGGGAERDGKTVFSGLRVTFPHWSPSSSDDVLSLWCTFSPTHRSVIARLLGGGLRSGDPAAILDARTGALSWMAVSPLEEAQIGHYHQIKREYSQAWQRYERAAAGLAEAAATAPTTGADWLARLLSPRGIAVFQYQCLRKLGCHDEARARLAEFRQAYPPPLPPAGPQPSSAGAASGLPSDQTWFRDLLRPGGLSHRLLQDLYIAEVMLSLDAAEDAKHDFRATLGAGTAQPEVDRLSAAVVLSQILLLEGKHDQYAQLASETLAPLLMKLRVPLPANQPSWNAQDFNRLLPDVIGALALLPLASRTFLSGLSPDRLNATVHAFERVREQAKDDSERLAVDFILEACYRQLGQEPARRRAVERIEHNPLVAATASTVSADLRRGVSDEMVDLLRGFILGRAGLGGASTP